MKININVLAQILLDKGFSIKDCDTELMDSDIMEYLSDKGLFDEIYDTMKLIKEE